MAMRRIFWGFCRNCFLMSPLHYLSIPILASNSRRYSYSKKRLPAITDTGSCRLRVSVIQGVANFPHHWYAESPTPRITDKRSRRLPASPIRRVGYWIFLKKTLRIVVDSPYRRRLPAPVIRWVTDSPYRRVGESPTPRITDTESRRLRVCRRLRGSWESLFKEKINLVSIFRAFNG
jgi:hypothetical protein